MKKLIVYLLSISFLIALFENCTISRQATNQNDYPEGNQLLIQYGEIVYQQESCGSCHSLLMERFDEDLDLVSLDGLGGKYSNIWHYYFLREPKMLIHDATMPASAHLHDRPLRKEVLEEVMEKNGTKNRKKDIETTWQQLLLEADLMVADIRQEEPAAMKRTEVLALISYLQEIPASETKLRIDRMESLILTEEHKDWEGMVLDNNSRVIKVANNEESIPLGGQLFKQLCSICHGSEGGGGIGPNLTDEYWLHGGKPVDIATTIAYGIPEKGMISWKSQITPTQVGQLVAYIKSISGTNPPNAKEPQGKKG